MNNDKLEAARRFHERAANDAKLMHFWQYEALAQAIGIVPLKAHVEAIAKRERPDDDAAVYLRAMWDTDPHLNNVPLHLWDAQHRTVQFIARHVTRSWSLGHTVCVLKHVAKYHVANVAPPTAAAFYRTGVR